MAAGKGLARLVRVVCVLAALGYGGYYAYDHVFQPGEIKRRVHDGLAAKFDGVDVEIGSARMRPFLGGVNVSDLKLIRRDDPTRTPFLHVPHAVIWHDKTEFPHRIVPAKIELEGAHLRLVRGTGGRWNVEGITRPPPDGERTPVLVLKKARIEVIDQKLGTAAFVDLEEIDVTVVNDPVNVYTFEAKGKCTPVGPFHVQGRFERGLGAAGSLDLGGIALGPELTRLVGLAAPEAVEHLQTVSGTAACRTRWTWKPGRVPVVTYDTHFDLRNGRCRSPLLPAPVEQLALKARVKDGDLTIESLTGRLGESGLDVKVEVDAPKVDSAVPIILLSPTDLEERVRRLEVTVSDLIVGPDLFERLPPKFAEARDLFSPAGPVDVTYEQRRAPPGPAKRLVFRAKGMTARYSGFPYPADHIRGTIEAAIDEDAPPRYEVDLVGEASGKPVTLKGRVTGGREREVDLVLTGSDIVLDKGLIDALPDDYPATVRRLNPTATGDFTAKIRHNARIRRDFGPEAFDNEFDIRVRTGSLTYEDFPYPLRNLSGNLLIRTLPDAPAPTDQPRHPPGAWVEFRDFTATGSGGCKLRAKGSCGEEPGGSLLTLEVKGEGVPFDGELSRAIARLKIETAWSTFDPSGRMNCEVHARIHDRSPPPGQPDPPFVPARDLELGLSFNGPTLRPTFFPYQLTEAAGQVMYAGGQVDLQQFRAKHGKTIVTLSTAKVLLPPERGFWADLYDVKMSPVVFDREFLAALPGGLRSACLGLEPQGNFSLHARRMVIDDQPKGRPPARTVPQVTDFTARGTSPAPRTTFPTIYWDGAVTFRDAQMKTGVPWDSVTGQFSSRGLYMGDRLGRVVGNLAIDRGRVLKQPVETLSARFEVDPAKPDVVSIPWLNGRLYGGEVGGQARLELGTPVRFDLSLNGSRLKLEEFARVNKLGPKTDIQGLATAQLSLSNPIDPATRLPVLQGSGTIDVPNGKMLDLPIMLDVIKLARLRPMDHTAFEEAHAVFRIRGDRVKVGQLDLLGNAISLGGEGEMNLDGSDAQYEFYTVWTNIRNMLGGGGDIAGRVSGNLFRIRVAGDLGSDRPPRVTQEALPGIVDPIRRLFGRVGK
ncbi:MAG TPA: hypothetical protein VKD90_12535 [Gemmataceae bacterium]|nr:hypothetical protein [Gemmataceae bacterium]